MEPKKFKQRFQTKQNDLKEQEFVEFLRIYPEFRRLPWPFSAWCPLKGRTYLNKPAAESWFV